MEFVYAWPGQRALIPFGLEGTEGVNSLFEYKLILQTPDALNFMGGDTDMPMVTSREGNLSKRRWEGFTDASNVSKLRRYRIFYFK